MGAHWQLREPIYFGDLLYLASSQPLNSASPSGICQVWPRSYSGMCRVSKMFTWTLSPREGFGREPETKLVCESIRDLWEDRDKDRSLGCSHWLHWDN